MSIYPEDPILKSIKKGIEKMPNLPITTNKVIEISQNPLVTPIQINQVISLDPILVGKVLKLVNSAYYTPGTRINSIIKAILLLGINTIKNLALTSSVIPIVTKSPNVSLTEEINLEECWKHSIACGVMTKLIAKKKGIIKKYLEEYFISGVLHDIGIILLSQFIPEKYIALIQKCKKEKIPLLELENQELKINHNQVGQSIAEKWNLSDSLVEAILYHHEPEKSTPKNSILVYSVAASNLFMDLNHIGFSGYHGNQSRLNDFLQYLNLDINEINRWNDSINDEINKASSFMKINHKLTN